MINFKNDFAMKLIPKLVGCSLVAFLFAQEAFAAKDVTKIGVTTIVKNKVLGEPPKMVQRKLKTGLEVYFNEKVETGPVGRTQLLFKDGTAITIGPNANMTIDKYVFDPNAGTGDMALSVTKGVFRIVGGRISKRKPIKLKTPVATLGVMGGIVVVDQAANGKLNADFLFGNKMTVTANNVTVTTKIPGRFISVTGSGQAPGPSQKRDRAEMKKNLEKLEGGGAEEKTAAPEEKAAPKKAETAKSEGGKSEATEENKAPATATSSSEPPAEENNEPVPGNEKPAATEKTDATPSNSSDEPAPAPPGAEPSPNNKGDPGPGETQPGPAGATETAAAPMPGGEGGAMPMPGGEGGMMPMPGGEGGAMPMMPMAQGGAMPMPGSASMEMPNINDMMDTGMGKMEMAPPMNIQMIMPPPPSGMDGMPMMPMPEPGPMVTTAGGPAGEAPAGVAGDIGNERNESFIKQPEILAGVPATAFINLSPEEVASVNAVLQDNDAGIALNVPSSTPNPDGSFNPNPPPGVFIITDPALAGGAPGAPIFIAPDGQTGFLPPPDGQTGFLPPPDGQTGVLPPPDGQTGVLPPPSLEGTPENGETVNEDCAPLDSACEIAAAPGPNDPAMQEPNDPVMQEPNDPVMQEPNDPVMQDPVAGSGPGSETRTEGLVMLMTHSNSSNDIIPVSQSPGLTYLVNNPDVMIHAQKAVRALGTAPGRDFQRAMEQVAIDHYNNFGRIEGRQLDGGTSTRTLIVQPKFNEPLINVSDSAALTYLVNNPDVMVHAQKAVRALRIAPGRDFQRAMEQVAIDHYNNFGRKEGRTSPR